MIKKIHQFVLAVLLLSGNTITTSSTMAAEPKGHLYVPEVDNNTVAVVDLASQKITSRIPVGPIAAHPAVMAATLDGSKLYTDNFGALPATMSVINRQTAKVLTVIVASTPLGIFTSCDGTEVYLPEVNSTIEVFSTATDRLLRTLHFSDIPAGAMCGPDGNLYVGFTSGLIGAYNPKTGAVIKPPIWSGGTLTFWYSFSKDGSKLYTDTVNKIGVIDVASWRLIKTINTSGTNQYSPNDPGAFTSTLSPDGKKLYVTLFGANRVLVVDTTQDRVIGSIPTLGSQIGITFSGDGTRGYISDVGASSSMLKGPIGESVLFGNLITVGLLGPGQLIEFDPMTDNIVKTIPTKAGPGIAVWEP